MSVSILQASKSDWVLRGFYFLSGVSFLFLALQLLHFCWGALWGAHPFVFGAGARGLFAASLKPMGVALLVALPLGFMGTYIRSYTHNSWGATMAFRFLDQVAKLPRIIFGFFLAALFFDIEVSLALISCLVVFLSLELILNLGKAYEQVPFETIESARAIGMGYFQIYIRFFVVEKAFVWLHIVARLILHSLALVLPLLFLVPRGAQYFSIGAFESMSKTPIHFDQFSGPLVLFILGFGFLTFLEKSLAGRAL